MRRKGIPQPSIRREDLMARSVAIEYEEMFDGLVAAAAEEAIDRDMRVEKREDGTVIVNDAGPDAIMHRLIDLLGERGPDVERLRNRLNAQLVGAQRKFLQDLAQDADRQTLTALNSMSIPAQMVFSQRLTEIRELYLNSAEERIQGEADWLKKSFLEKLVKWATGETKELHVTRLVNEMKETSARRARFFARDQFSRFNRSVMVASYRQAEAPYVEWLTCSDERVRPEHEIRNHKIYTMQGLIADPEFQSWNCRCGYAPLYELSADQLRRLVQ
jgi:SPP1 gp7 family putative phage head morphogenesis protein